MAAERSTALIRRDSAVLTSQLMKVPLTLLYNEDVPVDTRLASFSPDDPEGAKLFMLSEQETDMVKEQFSNRPFSVVNWLAKAIELRNAATGSVKRAVRVTLFDKENKTVAFTSEGIVKSLDILRIVYGDGPYPQGIEVYVGSVKTRSGFKMDQLTIKPPANGVQTAGK